MPHAMSTQKSDEIYTVQKENIPEILKQIKEFANIECFRITENLR